jgi:hypothetical protein
VNTKVCTEGTGLSLDYVSSKDGVSETLLLSENLRINKAHTWWDTDPTKVGFTDGPMADNIASNHAGLVVVTFCDGRQYSLSDKIDNRVFKALVTPDGDEPLDDSEY